MRNFSNTYIFIFSSVMVIIVAAILSTTAMLLQPIQQRNIEIEKKQFILASVNIESTGKNAESLYDKYITDSYVINSRGKRIEGVDAFSVNMADEIRKPYEERNLPIYIGTLDDGTKKYIVPLRGKGLWGPIYGYISFNNDFKTIFGATFDHDKETPGLGAEISTRAFQKDFKGKVIFDDTGNFTSILVVKGGAKPGSVNQVDAISGGTLTSKGLQAMLKDCLGSYVTYFKEQQNSVTHE
ncbi:MAG: NADH:ubiquinone reductase (Na(+)-transporting) subunit C [Chlorobi bacterium]|nr:NADH:ubiquinone reductase (Na(+)-transporting) subunit C [Chlorobiota bacterium]